MSSLLEQVQVLYEVAIDIGSSLDLDRMLKRALLTILRRLNCLGAIVLEAVPSPEGGEARFEQVYAVPRNIARSESSRTMLGRVPREQGALPLTAKAPAHALGRTKTATYCHLMELPGFGVLVLFKGEVALEPELVQALRPLCQKLADACRACLTAKALSEREELLARDKGALEAMVRARTAELERAHERLIETERLATLGRVAATLSHELRNPMGVVANGLYYLHRRLSPSDPAVTTTLQRMDRSIRRAEDIIQELLEFASRPKGQKEPTQIDRLLADTVAELGITDGVEVAVNACSGAVAMIYPDPLRRAILNVLENAVQAIKGARLDGRGTIAVSAHSLNRGDKVAIVVEDDGPGIPDEVLPRVLEPLFSTKTFGVGLGLAVVSEAMKQHGGEVSIESTPGRGTRVSLSLPVVEPTRQQAAAELPGNEAALHG